MKLSIFGLDSRGTSTHHLTEALTRLEGISSARVDQKRQIAEVNFSAQSTLTKQEVLQAVFSVGLAAEELS